MVNPVATRRPKPRSTHIRRKGATRRLYVPRSSRHGVRALFRARGPKDPEKGIGVRAVAQMGFAILLLPWKLHRANGSLLNGNPFATCLRCSANPCARWEVQRRQYLPHWMLVCQYKISSSNPCHTSALFGVPVVFLGQFQVPDAGPWP